jgi:DNA topoisomerase-1
MGIGRPSTYASIIDTILAREYVFKRGNALVPTWTAFAVSQLLASHLPKLVDYQFTAQMEEDLDAISRGERENLQYLREFYFGNGQSGLKPHLENKVDEIDARDVSRIRLGTPDGQEEIVVRVGRYGPFLEQGSRRAAIPEGTAPDELTIEKCLELLGQAQQAEEPLGYDPESGKPVYLKVGRFGPYVQRGGADEDEKPQNASLLKGMTPEQIDLDAALKLLSLPRELGTNPQNAQPVVAHNGRFGPYVKCGEETRSLPGDVSPLDVTLEQALQLLAQPKAQRRGFGAKREPMKVFEPSPANPNKIELLDGRYGLYVTDGTTNASLPKNMTQEELTVELALRLLADRAAAGPPKKAARRGTARKAGVAKAAVGKQSSPKTPKTKAPAAAKKSAKKKPGR